METYYYDGEKYYYKNGLWFTSSMMKAPLSISSKLNNMRIEKNDSASMVGNDLNNDSKYFQSIQKQQCETNVSTGKTVWIKFEGAQNPNKYANLHSVTQDGKEWFVLNFSKRPIKVKEGDSFFMSEGIVDSSGKSHQVITGRGHLYGFNANNYVPEAWMKYHPWIMSYPWYVIIKDFEMLDTNISNGLMLEQVIIKLGTETYEASSGKGRNYEYLMRMHLRRAHMKLTSEAEVYINQKFDELVNRFGSRKYYTNL